MTLTYGIGDKVIHPAYGAGIVKRVVRKTIAGEPRQYYLIDPLAYDDLEIMVAVDKVKRIGLRNAVKRSEMTHALSSLMGQPEQVSTDYKERQELISAKLESGDPYQVAEVVRDLAAFSRLKHGHLGSKDTQLLKQARECLAGELAVVEDIAFEEALDRIDQALMLADEEPRAKI